VILVDTGPLVALCDPRDSLHGTAVGHLRTLVKRDFGVCDAVLNEACFHLPHDSQRKRLRALLQDLTVAILPATPDHRFAPDVFGWLEKYADQEPDWADGCLAVLSERDAAVKVWTYGREFRTTWRRPNGTAIPMAVRRA
jgi:predicted nucleic acid-binding protein